MVCKISVIVPCYNQEKYIKECLDSLVSQTFKDYEVIKGKMLEIIIQ